MATTRKLTEGESYAVVPGVGFVICHPERSPVVVRVVDGALVDEPIDLSSITPAPVFIPGQGQLPA
jgi:hypothetical protein